MQTSTKHASWRAPGEDLGVLIDPAPAEWADLIAENHRRLDRRDVELSGGSLAAWRSRARASLLAAATAFTAQLVDRATPGESDALLLTGHQPELFHPGVWAKNFLVSAAARRLGATGVNLIVDGDLARNAVLRCPAGSVAQPRTESIALDAPAGQIPYEERRLIDADILARAQDQIAAAAAELGWRPLAAEAWPTVVESTIATGKLGEGFARARRRIESDFGCENLEITQSRWCRSEAFAAFVAAVLSDAERFRKVYNAALASYRVRHRLRSHSHPAPDLHCDVDWIETPFWTWSASDPRRRPLYVRRRRDLLELSDHAGGVLELPYAATGESLVAALFDLQHGDDWKIRPRALATTAAARMLFCDLFVHGIGGGNYDEATDELLAGFFGIEPPEFVVATATLRLPIAREPFDQDAASRLRGDLWRLRYHGEHFLDEATLGVVELEQAERLAVEKRRLLAEPPPADASAKAWRGAMHEVNLALANCLEPLRLARQKALSESQAKRRAERILSSREYSFVLHDAESLHRLQEVIRDRVVG